MNAVPPTVTRALLDMLGARWRVGVGAAEVAWDNATGIAGFALTDGTLALAHSVWEGAPSMRPREGGGVKLVPGTAPAPPAARAKAHHGACVSVAADPDGGFLAGGTDGRITHVQVDGALRAIAHLDGPVSQVVTGPGHWRAFAVRDTVHRLGGDAAQIKLPGPVSALALAPGGVRLAIGHPNGVTLWAGGDTPRVLAAPQAPAGLCWSADGASLASFSQDGMLRALGWPAAAASDLSAGADVGALCALTTGSFAVGIGGRIACWSPPDPELRPCGAPNQAAVTRLACHPGRPLLAVGYANGTVVLCHPDEAGFLLLRAAGEGVVSALKFSASGSHLAIGTDGGEIALVMLPEALFRQQKKRS